jgi:hypothetical protein
MIHLVTKDMLSTIARKHMSDTIEPYVLFSQILLEHAEYDHTGHVRVVCTPECFYTLSTFVPSEHIAQFYHSYKRDFLYWSLEGVTIKVEKMHPQFDSLTELEQSIAAEIAQHDENVIEAQQA